MSRNPEHPDRNQVASDFDSLTEDYERQINAAISFGGNEHQFYIDVKRDHLLRLSQAALGPTTALDVLDLGCGIGGYHAGLEGCFRQLHGAEISERSIEVAKSAHPWVHYAHIDSARLPYEDARFDMVFAICVMHHVPPADWDGFVSEMHRVLKSGGIGLIFEHNPYNPATQYIVRSCEIDKDAVLLKPAKLRRMFKKASFKEVNTRTLLSVPPKGTILSKLDTVFGYLPFGAQYYLTARK